MSEANQGTGKTLAAALVLFFAALLLTAYTKERPAAARWGSALLGELLRPVQSLHGALRHGAAGVWERYLWLIDAQSENRRLRRRVAELEERNSRLREVERENERLRGIVGLAQAEGLRLLVADVIGYDPSNWVQVITINRGRAHGVREEMAVVEGGGVVGQVISASAASARVLLLTDHTSGIDAVIQSSRARGVLEGLGRFRCRLSYVPAQEDVRVGDRVVSSGMDGVFPKGLMLGTVSQVAPREGGRMFRRIEVRPAVDFLKLESVAVVLGGDREVGR